MIEGNKYERQQQTINALGFRWHLYYKIMCVNLKVYCACKGDDKKYINKKQIHTQK